MSVVSLELAKQRCGILDEDRDSLIEQYINEAIEQVEALSGHLLERREVTQEAKAFGDYLELFWGPAPEDVVISYIDASDVGQDIGDANLVRSRAYPPSAGWPETATNSVISVTYTAGWATAPARLIGAVLVLIDAKFKNDPDTYAAALTAAENLCGSVRGVMV